MPSPILQSILPLSRREAALNPIPQMRPVTGAWLRRDDAFDAQLALKSQLIAQHKEDVLHSLPGSEDAQIELLEIILAQLDSAYQIGADRVRRPDGAWVALDWTEPLRTASQLIQEDLCLLQKRGGEHVLTAALLCFPASWTLAQKIGRPLSVIHVPVPEYNAEIATRVQRLFDGIQPGRPIWRANLLRYDDPSLYQPRREDDPRETGSPDAKYWRSERQTVLRLPKSQAVLFAIHTLVVEA
ncbi:DUF3445 domain-containing protein [Aestuariibius sp. HNIBRBA575]|uniref:heme-dependent oxidative N-demethylase family protein n=1 Tax=Aestuariibius sp. HNIBRBA575 TaxID=3233343 RepID=UPI0034A1706E